MRHDPLLKLFKAVEVYFLSDPQAALFLPELTSQVALLNCS